MPVARSRTAIATWPVGRPGAVVRVQRVDRLPGCSFISTVRQVPPSAVGFTHASSVMPATRSSELESAIVTRSFVAVEAQRRGRSGRRPCASAPEIVPGLPAPSRRGPRCRTSRRSPGADQAREDGADGLAVGGGVGRGRARRRELVRGGAAVGPRRRSRRRRPPWNWLGGAATPTVESCATERVNGVVDASPPTASRRPRRDAVEGQSGRSSGRAGPRSSRAGRRPPWRSGRGVRYDGYSWSG